MPDDKKKVTEAAAIKYDAEDMNAPVVVAVGHGSVAERIVQAAEEHNVPVVKDEGLAKLLSALSVGDAIPEELYGVVAQLLVFISEMDESYASRLKSAAHRAE